MGKIAKVHAIDDDLGAWYSRLSPGSPRCSRLTRLLTDGIWVPMATVHFAAVTAALLAGWIAVWAKG